MNENDYPLTIEILEDCPCNAELMKGDICKAKKDADGDYHVFDTAENGLSPYWAIMEYHAKVI